MIADFQTSGSCPIANESLNMIDNGKAIGRAILLRRKAGNPSGVCDNLVGSLSKHFHIDGGSNSISATVLLVRMLKSGILLLDLVKTSENCSEIISAFSLLS